MRRGKSGIARLDGYDRAYCLKISTLRLRPGLCKVFLRRGNSRGLFSSFCKHGAPPARGIAAARPPRGIFFFQEKRWRYDVGMETMPKNLPKFLENGAVLDSGKIVDGRASATGISKLIARFAQKMRGSSGLAKAIEGAQEAADNLKLAGFDPAAIDRVMWFFNEPFPLSAMTCAERILTSNPHGIAEVAGKMTRLYSGNWLADAKRWKALSFSEGSGRLGMWREGYAQEIKGAGGLGLSAAIALGAWRGRFQRFLMSSGIGEQESKRFIAGHELGHVVFHASKHAELAENLLLGAGFDKERSSAWATIKGAAEELFADALGAAAATPSDMGRVLAAVADARRRKNAFFTADAIYIRRHDCRSVVAERLMSGAWTPSDGAADLAAECLAMAIAGLSLGSMGEARRIVGEAFAEIMGRPLSEERGVRGSPMDKINDHARPAGPR